MSIKDAGNLQGSGGTVVITASARNLQLIEPGNNSNLPHRAARAAGQSGQAGLPSSWALCPGADAVVHIYPGRALLLSGPQRSP